MTMTNPEIRGRVIARMLQEGTQKATQVHPQDVKDLLAYILHLENKLIDVHKKLGEIQLSFGKAQGKDNG